MNEKEKFGELASQALNIGVIADWSSWNVESRDWDTKYGIITAIKNEIKGGRLVSVSKVAPLSGSKAEMEFFTLGLKPISHSKREKIQNKFNS